MTARVQQGAHDTVFPGKPVRADFLSPTPRFRSMISGHRGPPLAPGSEQGRPFREPDLADGEAAAAWLGEHSDTDKSPALVLASFRRSIF